MKFKKLFAVSLAIFCASNVLFAQESPSNLYVNNRAPLKLNTYTPLPLGAIEAKGWLKEQLLRMKTGLTGDLDKRYPQVVGERNAWLGGDGDAWERGPYWIDGLLPLAYILKDQELINKVKPWIDWTLNNQRDDGYMGPLPMETKPEDGLQKDMQEDWWPKMVMLKILQQYHQATADDRVITALIKYFQYQLKHLPEQPLDHWTFWGNQRGADNLMVVYWLYNITGEHFLLDLGELIYQQTFPFTKVFLNDYNSMQNGTAHLYPYNIGNRYPFKEDLINKLHVGQLQSFHCVNLAQGIKAPIIYYQQNPDSLYLKAVKRAFKDIEIFHGQAQGMYGGDEPLHGNNPTQGIEFCSIVELMFSLESMLPITGDVGFADHLEKIAYNALPTQATDDFNYRQYLQSANQVKITRAKRNFFEDDPHDGTDLCYGLLTGYPCCTSNMHQGWPKFVQNLWYSTADGGLAALVYGPSQVTAKVARGVDVTITEKTNYPFEETVSFTIQTKQKVNFPFHLRIPHWAEGAKLLVNGKEWSEPVHAGTTVKINREWNDRDEVQLALPMQISTSRWAESSVAVERGPLVYALKIGEDWRKVQGSDRYGNYYEVYPTSAWNYGLLMDAINRPEQYFEVIKSNHISFKYPWNLENAPISIHTKGKKIPSWQLYNHMPGPLPHSLPQRIGDQASESITLVPYGCTTLRITQFPLVN
ncbi:glycoside hydrolase family 127 protein [Olivibacter sp. SDN3]|uniref:beta-L-arabinofuranosidase domain-containing protein n=1 Tax=Olivibacter sp. SDN3 TaxID=2764720 RepID=UPI0016510F83|nr:beta-L-arabinofuranosidase domain-containing protein [Olivibacter sp. SDN3]QNL50166.1 glycoside hydrolase family 127 protein [Olivibacter sp. SDN3]